MATSSISCHSMFSSTSSTHPPIRIPDFDRICSKYPSFNQSFQPKELEQLCKNIDGSTSARSDLSMEDGVDVESPPIVSKFANIHSPPLIRNANTSRSLAIQGFPPLIPLAAPGTCAEMEKTRFGAAGLKEAPPSALDGPKDERTEGAGVGINPNPPPYHPMAGGHNEIEALTEKEEALGFIAAGMGVAPSQPITRPMEGAAAEMVAHTINPNPSRQDRPDLVRGDEEKGGAPNPNPKPRSQPMPRPMEGRTLGNPSRQGRADLVSGDEEKGGAPNPNPNSPSSHHHGLYVGNVPIGPDCVHGVNDSTLISKRTTLKFVPPEIIDGQIFVRPTWSAALEGMKRWNNTIVGYFVGKKPPFFGVRSFAQDAWTGLVEVKSDTKGFFFFRFRCETSMLDVLEGGPWLFAGQAIFLQKWQPGMTLEKKPHQEVPVWVKFRNVPTEHWTIDGLSTIASSIGRPLYPDAVTLAVDRIDYARVCVVMNVAAEFRDHIYMFIPSENGEYQGTCKISIEYEWKPLICTSCKVFGHTHSNCPSLTKSATLPPVRVYVPKPASRAPPQVIDPAQVQPSNGTNRSNIRTAEWAKAPGGFMRNPAEWTLVTRGKGARVEVEHGDGLDSAEGENSASPLGGLSDTSKSSNGADRMAKAQHSQANAEQMGATRGTGQPRGDQPGTPKGVSYGAKVDMEPPRDREGSLALANAFTLLAEEGVSDEGALGTNETPLEKLATDVEEAQARQNGPLSRISKTKNSKPIMSSVKLVPMPPVKRRYPQAVAFEA